MSFSDHKIQTFTHKISDLPDQPNMQPEELKAHFDSSPEELRQALNALCDALAAQTAAADIGFAQTAGVPETTVQKAIENVQSQVTEAIIGSIPSGSITSDKLAQDVRDRLTNIENSVTTEAGTRAGADSNLQSQIDTHTTQIAGKCTVVAGYYDGDGQATRLIPLSGRPKAVYVTNTFGQVYDNYCYYGGLAVADLPAGSQAMQLVTITDQGFNVFYRDMGQYDIMTNHAGNRYFYVAWM